MGLLDEAIGEFNEHGQDSWAYDQRGFDYIVRDQTGYNDAIHYPVFGVTGRQKYQRLIIKALAGAKNIDLNELSDDDIAAAIADVLAPDDSEEARQEKLATWDPADLLVPEWRYLQKPSLFPQQQNSSGLMVTEMQRDADLHPRISRVVAVNKMKKVNAVLGFTRLDEMDRVNPIYIPRNSKVEEALAAAVDEGDLGPFLLLVEVVGHPYVERTEWADFASPSPPEYSNYRTFCGT